MTKRVVLQGTIDRAVEVPRCSMGPDVQQMVLGSEGSLGVITEAVLRLRKLPPLQKYGSLIFPNLEAGVNFMREVANQRGTLPAHLYRPSGSVVCRPVRTNPISKSVGATEEWVFVSDLATEDSRPEPCLGLGALSRNRVPLARIRVCANLCLRESGPYSKKGLQIEGVSRTSVSRTSVSRTSVSWH